MNININIDAVDDIYRVYENSFKQQTEQIQLRLLKQFKNAHEQYNDNLQKAQSDLAEAEQYLKMMELEAQNYPINSRKTYQESIKNYKKDIQKLNKDINKIEFQNEEQQKDKLFGERVTTDQINQALLKQEDRINNQNLRLLEAKQVAYDAEETAISVQRNLQNQTEQLKNSIQKTQLTFDDLDESNSITNRLKLRIYQRRLMTYSLIAFVSLCGAYVIYTWIS